MQKITFFLFFIVTINCQAQNFDLNIFVKNISTSEVVEYANIFITPCSCGGTTDEKGNLTIPLPADTYQVITSYVGFQNDTTAVVLNKNISR